MDTLQNLALVCASRGYRAETWYRLLSDATLQQAGNDNSATGDSETARIDLAIDSLVAIILPSGNHGPAIGKESIYSYLQHCCSRGASARRHLQDRLISFVAEREDDNSIMDPELVRTLDAVSGLVLASGPPLAPSRALSVPAVVAVLGMVTLAIGPCLLSLFTLACHVLQGYTSFAGSRAAESAALPKSVADKIDVARDSLRQHSDSRSPNLIPLAFQIEAVKVLDALQGMCTRTVSAPLELQQKEGEDVVSPALPSEIEILMSYAFQSDKSRLPGLLRASLASRFSYFGAESGAASLHSIAAQWLQDVLRSTAKRLTRADPSQPSRSDDLWQAFGLGLLPGALAHLDPPSDKWTSNAEEWRFLLHQAAKAAGSGQPDLVSADLSAVFPATGAVSLSEFSNKVPQDCGPQDLTAALHDVQRDYRYHASACAYTLQRISAWQRSSDIPAIVSLFRALAQPEGAVVADFLLLYTPGHSLLECPVALLDTWDAAEEYGANTAMELFGGLLLAVQTLAHRHGIHPRGKGFAASVVKGLSALAYARPLEALNPEHKRLVGLWISALYGNEGIEDDLIRSTGPKVMLALAPTIIEQSLVACEIGVIDHDTLLGGLSYFTQHLLNYTLLGIVTFLARRVTLHPSSFQLSLTVIKSLLTSDSTPACLTELAGPELVKLFDNAEASDPSYKADVTLLKSRIAEPLASRIDMDSFMRSLQPGNGNCSGQTILEGLRAVSRLHEPRLLAQVCEQQHPLVGSLLLSIQLEDDMPPLFEYLPSGHRPRVPSDANSSATLAKLRLQTAA